MKVLKSQKSLLALLCLFCTLYSHQSIAQIADTKTNVYKNKLYFTLGVNQGYLKDQAFSPLNYKEGGLRASLGYSRASSEKSLLNVNLSFSLNEMQSDASEYFDTNYLNGTLDINYLRNLFQFNNQWHLYLGGELSGHYHIINYNELDAFSFVMAHSIGLKVHSVYQINAQHELSSGISWPILSLVVRPPYNGFDEKLDENEDKPLRLITEGGKLRGFSDYFVITWNLNYLYNFSKRFSLNAGYTLHFQKLAVGSSFTHFQNQLTTGITYHF